MMANGILYSDIEVHPASLFSIMNNFSCDSEAVIGIYKDENKTPSVIELKSIAQDVCGKTGQDIICRVLKNKFCAVSEFLVNVSAEVIVIYCSNDSKNVYSMLQRENDSFELHKEWIREKICNYIITWVANEKGFYVNYDPKRITKQELLSKFSY